VRRRLDPGKPHRPDPSRPEYSRPGSGRPEYTRPEYARPDHTRTHAGRPTAVRPEAGRPARPGPERFRPTAPGQTAGLGPLPTTHAAAAAASLLVGHPTRHGGTALPGGLLSAAAPVATPQLGAFVRRSIVVAPPRVSVRPVEPRPAAGGPPTPASVRGGSRSSSTGGTSGSANRHNATGHGANRHNANGHGATGHGGTGMAPQPAPAAGGDTPVIRRSLSTTAHALFRSLLATPAARSSADAVLAEGNGMFDSTPTHEPAVVRRFRQPGPDPDQHHSAGDEPSPAMQARDFDELIDRIVAKLEHRILEDLERRGRRGIPEVF
jgi:hypothetical protein